MLIFGVVKKPSRLDQAIVQTSFIVLAFGVYTFYITQSQLVNQVLYGVGAYEGRDLLIRFFNCVGGHEGRDRRLL